MPPPPDRSRPVWTYVLSALAVAVPAAFLAVSALWVREDLERAAVERTERLTVLLQEHAYRVLEAVDTHLRLVRDAVEFRGWPETLPDERSREGLQRLAEADAQVQGFALVDGEGRVLVPAPADPGAPVSAADRDHFRAARAGGDRIVVGVPVQGRLSGRDVLPVARPLRTSAGSFAGIVVAGVPVSVFADFYASVLPNPNDVITLIRADGQVLLREPWIEGGLVRIRSGLTDEIAARPEGGSYRLTARTDGIERHFAYRRIGTHDLYVTHGTDIAQVRSAWLGEMALPAIVALAAALLMLAAVEVQWRQVRLRQAMLLEIAAEAERRREAEAALRRTQGLDLLGQMTGGVVHNVNNLMTAVLGNAVAARRTAGPAAAPHLDAIEQAVEQGSALSRQLLAFTRQGLGRPVATDLNAAIRRMERLLDGTAGPDVPVELRLAPVPCPAEVDPAEFEMALLNLVANARDAMPDGGRIAVSTSVETSEGGRRIVLEVSDTGTGMPPEVAARAFEPFFTTKEVGRGTGLGLSGVYGFARAAGGDAEIDTAPGRGTTVRIRLPASRAPALAAAPPALAAAPEPQAAAAAPAAPGRAAQPAPRAAARPPAPQPGGPAAVLLVEDEPLVRMSAARDLEDAGFSVVQAGDAETALAALDAADGRIAAMVSDVSVPGRMNGVELARRVRGAHPSVGILLTSGYAPDARDPAGSLEEFPFLAKPYRPEELAERVRALAGPPAAAARPGDAA
jgi:two-component system NtrC family sensor kinase